MISTASLSCESLTEDWKQFADSRLHSRYCNGFPVHIVIAYENREYDTIPSLFTAC